MTYQYRTAGQVCSQASRIEIRDDGRIGAVEFAGGCPGNLQGIGKLVSGMKPEEVIERLSGIRCGGKPTSCPDQLARALQAILRKREGK